MRGAGRGARPIAAAGEHAAATAALARAIDVAEATGLPAPAWEGNAALARLAAASGHETVAAQHSARARAILGELAARRQRAGASAWPARGRGWAALTSPF